MNNSKTPFSDWLDRNWHPLCGIVYLVICLGDFLLLPVYYTWYNAQFTPEKIVQLATTFKDSASQIAALTSLREERIWAPVTLQQNGLFHIAFGAILGVGIWARGKQQGTDALNGLTSQIQSIVANNNNPSPAVVSTTTTTSTGI